MEARDGANVPRRSYSTLTLRVGSNLEKPVWATPGSLTSFEASTTIYETHDYVTSVYSFQANDADTVVRFLNDLCLKKFVRRNLIGYLFEFQEVN